MFDMWLINWDAEVESSTIMSQRQQLMSHLSDIPTGVESRNQVRLIRLVNKRKFLKLPVIQRYNQELFEILKDFRIFGSIANTRNNIKLGFETSTTQARFQSFAQSAIEQRDAIFSLLSWQNDDSDRFCEVFPINECPPFTFISHRWAGNGQYPLGLHNELVYFFSFVKHDYFWVDFSCVLQDKINYDNGNLMKIIWNVDSIIDVASHVMTYYMSDGLMTTDTSFSKEFDYFSLGFLHLYHCTCPNGLSGTVFKTIHKKENEWSHRIWCCFEKRCGEGKILQVNNYDHSLFHLKLSEEEARKVMFSDLMYPDMHTAAGFSFREMLSSCTFSFDCHDPSDIEPLTTVLYQRNLLPFTMQNGDVKCLISASNGENEWVSGILLPSIIEDEDTKVSTTKLNGWQYIEKVAGIVALDSFFLIWQLPGQRQHQYLLHRHCLKKHQHLTYFPIGSIPSHECTVGGLSKYGYTYPSCILCPEDATPSSIQNTIQSIIQEKEEKEEIEEKKKPIEEKQEPSSCMSVFA